MRPEQWRRARTILELAASRPPGERVRCIADHCSDDPALQTELETLLSRYVETPDFDAFLRSPTPPFDQHTTEVTGTDGAPPRASDMTTHTDESPSASARSWGDFTLLQELGRGGFGVVYRAWDPGLRREVALKLFNTRQLGGASARLLTEGQLLARVNQHHVVRVFSAVRIGDEVGLAMELINGRTLAALVGEQGPLGCEEAAVVGLSLCDALAAVHSQGLVHRDLKPSNVMRENGGRIVLMDFGAGRDRSDRASGSDVVGTPAYVAPELLFGADDSPASDIYSLGVLLFYLVTARHPVQGRGFDGVRQAHLRGERLSLAECRLDLPARFVDVVERALSSAPGDRFRSPQEFRDRLAEAMPGLSPEDDTSRMSRSGPVPAPSGGMHWLVKLALAAAAAPVLFTILGFIETTFLNLTLDRRGAFGQESLAAYLKYGWMSLVAPILYVGLAVLLFNVFALIARVAGRMAPAIARSVSNWRGAIQRRLYLAGLGDPDTFVQALCVVALIGLVAHLWYFAPLILAYAGVASAARAPAEDLAILGSERIALHAAYCAVLVILMFMLATGLWTASKAAARRRNSLSAGPMIASGMLLAILLFLLAGPWRILFSDSFPEVRVDDRQCFIIGEAGDELLLHCPTSPASRNQVVRRDDPRLPATRGNYGKLFDAYGAAPAAAK